MRLTNIYKTSRLTAHRYLYQMVKRVSIVPINTTDSENRLPNHYKVRTIKEHFRLKIDKYLRTASFKSNLLVLIKKECT